MLYSSNVDLFLRILVGTIHCNYLNLISGNEKIRSWASIPRFWPHTSFTLLKHFQCLPIDFSVIYLAFLDSVGRKVNPNYLIYPMEKSSTCHVFHYDRLFLYSLSLNHTQSRKFVCYVLLFCKNIFKASLFKAFSFDFYF